MTEQTQTVNNERLQQARELAHAVNTITRTQKAPVVLDALVTVMVARLRMDYGFAAAALTLRAMADHVDKLAAAAMPPVGDVEQVTSVVIHSADDQERAREVLLKKLSQMCDGEDRSGVLDVLLGYYLHLHIDSGTEAFGAAVLNKAAGMLAGAAELRAATPPTVH